MRNIASLWNWCPGGLEDQKPVIEAPESQREIVSASKPVSLGASPNSEQLCSELSEIVAAWPKLTAETRAALLTLLRAAKGREP